jgi:hypothetical protein
MYQLICKKVESHIANTICQGYAESFTSSMLFELHLQPALRHRTISVWHLSSIKVFCSNIQLSNCLIYGLVKVLCTLLTLHQGYPIPGGFLIDTSDKYKEECSNFGHYCTWHGCQSGFSPIWPQSKAFCELIPCNMGSRLRKIRKWMELFLKLENQRPIGCFFLAPAEGLWPFLPLWRAFDPRRCPCFPYLAPCGQKKKKKTFQKPCPQKS